MIVRRPVVSALAAAPALSLAVAAGWATVVSPLAVVAAVVAAGVALTAREAARRTPSALAVALALTAAAAGGVAVVRAPAVAAGALIAVGVAVTARVAARRTPSACAVVLALAAAAAGGVAAARAPALALGLSGVVLVAAAVARWGPGVRSPASAGGAGRPLGAAVSGFTARLAQPTLAAAAVASAVLAGAALGGGKWAIAVLIVAFGGWLLAASRWGPAAAAFAVVTVALPLYGVPGLASLTAGLGLFTVLILGLLLPAVAIQHWRPLRSLLSDRYVQLVLVFGALVVLSLLTASRTDLSLELAKTYAGRAVVLPLLICAVLVGLGRRRAFAAVQGAAVALVAVALFGAVLSVVQVGFATGYPASGDGERQALLQFVGARAIGFSESPGTWAAFLLVPFGFAAAFAAHRLRAVPIIGLLAVSAGLLLSGLRSAWVAMAAATVVAVGLGHRVRYGLAVALVVLAAVGATLQLGNFRSFLSGGSPAGVGEVGVGIGRLASDESARGRILLLRAELALGAAHPLTGVGLGNIGTALEQDRPSFIDRQAERLGVVPGVPIEKHNVFTGLFAELGLPGLLAFVVVLGVGTAALLQCRRAATPSERVLVNGLLAALAATIVVANATEVDRQVFIWWTVGVSLGLRAAMFGAPKGDCGVEGVRARGAPHPTRLGRPS